MHHQFCQCLLLNNYDMSANTSLKSKSKKFWNFLNKNMFNYLDTSKVVPLNDNLFSSELESIELISSYFSSVYSSVNILCNCDSLEISHIDLPCNVFLNVCTVFYISIFIDVLILLWKNNVDIVLIDKLLQTA